MEVSEKKTKKILLILWPYRFRNFDYYRFELDQMEKEFNLKILIHDLADCLHPSITKVYLNLSDSKKVTKYKSLSSWKLDFYKLLKDNKNNILVWSEVNSVNLKCFKINLILKKSKVTTFQLSKNRIPMKKIKVKNILQKLVAVTMNLPSLKIFLINNFFLAVAYQFSFFPNYLIACGSVDFNDKYYTKKKFKKNVRILRGHSIDYSNYLTYGNNDQSNDNNYGLMLDSSGPKFLGDGVSEGKDHSHTIEKWYPALNNFFSNIEKILNIKIKIAPHPKTVHEKFPSYFGYREVINQKLVYAAKNTKVILSKGSTSLSYAVIYNKPILIIYSDEIKKHEWHMADMRSFSDALGIKLINIDEVFDKNKIIKALEIDKVKYSEYKTNYLTSRTDSKPNYKIIMELFSK